jgi:hypothetical protein
MCQRNFKDIKEIYESSLQTEVNTFLEKEWQLLDIYQKSIGGIPTPQSIPVYILGRPKNILLTSSEIKKEIEKEAQKGFEDYCKNSQL